MGRLKTFAFRRGYYPLDLLRVRLACKRNNIEDESQMQYNKKRNMAIQFCVDEVGFCLRDLLK